MTLTVDPELPLCSPAAPPGVAGDVTSALTLAGQARPQPYRLEAGRVVVLGDERGGNADVHIDGRTVLGGLVADTGMGVNVVVSPSSVRRECVGGRGTAMEVILALPTLPMAAFQWDAPGELELSFTVLPGEGALRVHAADRTLRAEPPDSAGGAEVLVDPAPSTWHTAAAPAGGVHVRVTVSSPGTVTLLVAAGPSAATHRALKAGAHLGAHAIRSATDQDPANAGGLLPSTGVAEVDDGVGWASLRLAGALRHGAPENPADWFWAGLGALASGDVSGVLLGADEVRRAASVPISGEGRLQAPGEALWALLSARATLLSGDDDPVRRTLAALSPTELEERRRASGPHAWAWWGLALGALADALRYSAPEPEVQALRALATLPAGGVPRALPMLGHAPSSGLPAGSAPWLRALLRGGGVARRDAPESNAELAPWCAVAAGDVEDGYASWRALLGRGLAGSWGPRGSWSPPGRGPALVMGTLAFGLLGLEPDAPSGRLRCAPVLPAHLKAFRVRGIRVGRSVLSLAYERAGGTHRFQVIPLEGPVPPMVVLEPSIPAGAVGDTRVDGVPADLTREAWQGRGTTRPRTRVQVQFAADGPRVLEVDEA